MIRHHVLMTLSKDAKDQAEVIVRELSAYAANYPPARSYHVGRDLGLADNIADVAVVAEFDSVDDYLAYSADEEHQRIIREHIAPYATSLVRVQTEF